jgi:hypothetical protein
MAPVLWSGMRTSMLFEAFALKGVILTLFAIAKDWLKKRRDADRPAK